MSTLNGIGTKLLGESDLRDDGSYIATKWFVFAEIPLVPLASYRVYEEQSDLSSVFVQTRSYRLQPIPLYWKQVLPFLVMIWAIIAVTVVLIYIATIAESILTKFLCISILGLFAAFALGKYFSGEELS
jgi:hypothetical protein